MADFAIARTDAIPGSPTLRLPDGTTISNPGIAVHWEGPWAAGYPIIDSDDRRVYEDLLRRAAPCRGRRRPHRAMTTTGASSAQRLAPEQDTVVSQVVLRRIGVGPLQTNCWALHASGCPQALVVDPGDEPARILDSVADLQVTAIVLSHAHFDHVLAVPDLTAALDAPVLAHPDDAPVWPHELATLAREPGTSTPAPPLPSCSPPATRCGPIPGGPLGRSRRPLPRRRRRAVRRPAARARPAHPRTHAGRHQPRPPRRGGTARARVDRRHAVSRRTRAHRMAPVGLPHHPHVGPSAARPPRRDRSYIPDTARTPPLRTNVPGSRAGPPAAGNHASQPCLLRPRPAAPAPPPPLRHLAIPTTRRSS